MTNQNKNVAILGAIATAVLFGLGCAGVAPSASPMRSSSPAEVALEGYDFESGLLTAAAVLCGDPRPDEEEAIWALPHYGRINVMQQLEAGCQASTVGQRKRGGSGGDRQLQTASACYASRMLKGVRPVSLYPVPLPGGRCWRQEFVLDLEGDLYDFEDYKKNDGEHSLFFQQ